RAGGKVLAQDEASSVVYGMPRVVTELRLVDEVHSLSDMAAALVRVARETAAPQAVVQDSREGIRCIPVPPTVLASCRPPAAPTRRTPWPTPGFSACSAPCS